MQYDRLGPGQASVSLLQRSSKYIAAPSTERKGLVPQTSNLKGLGLGLGPGQASVSLLLRSSKYI